MAPRVRRLPEALSRALRRFERGIGADREGRSLWVWLGPLITVVGTFAVTMKVSADGSLGLAAALPLAVLLCTFMGGMSVAYLTAAAADLRDAEAEDGDDPGGPGRGRPPAPPAPPAPRPAVRRWVEIVSVRRQDPGDCDGRVPERERELERAGGPRPGHR